MQNQPTFFYDFYDVLFWYFWWSSSWCVHFVHTLLMKHILAINLTLKKKCWRNEYDDDNGLKVNYYVFLPFLSSKTLQRVTRGNAVHIFSLFYFWWWMMLRCEEKCVQLFHLNHQSYSMNRSRPSSNYQIFLAKSEEKLWQSKMSK